MNVEDHYSEVQCCLGLKGKPNHINCLSGGWVEASNPCTVPFLTTTEYYTYE